MALISGALVTATEADTFCQVQNPDHDVVIEMLINSVSQALIDAIGCDLSSSVHTSEKHDGSGRTYLFLNSWPVTTLTTVIEDGTTLTNSTDFYADLDNGVLWKTAGYKWTTNREGVVVTYTAGEATVPADIKLAALEEIARRYQKYITKDHGETSRSTEGSSVSKGDDKPAWDDVIDKYQRIRI